MNVDPPGIVFERNLLRLVDDYLAGQIDFREFRENYVRYYVDTVADWTGAYYASMPPDEWRKPVSETLRLRLAELMVPDRLEFFQLLREKTEWTASTDPNPTDRTYGWRNPEELRQFMRTERRRYRAMYGH